MGRMQRSAVWRYTGFSLLLVGVLALPGVAIHAAPGAVFQVAPPFREYYAAHQGLRVLGIPLTGLIEDAGHAAQYFEKGRIEDHRAKVADPRWAFMYGRLTAELLDRTGHQALSVNATSLTYGGLRRAADPALRHDPPPGFQAGTAEVPEGIFVPYHPELRFAPGYVVPRYFWDYITDTALFPGGWLHDIGLPLTDAVVSDTVKQGEPRQIMLQAFERAVLTYDPLNPSAWQVERGNIGADALRDTPPAGPIETPVAGAEVTLPLPIVARVGAPGEPITITLRWKNGVTLSRTVAALRGSDGRGLLVTNLDWQTESRAPQPTAHGAALELRDVKGALLATAPLEVLRWDDPGVQRVDVYWYLGHDRLQAAQRVIPRTARIGTAALEELLWGPRPGNLAGFRTALPTPEEVLTYAQRESDWGARVTLRRLVIEQGVATADFSRELRAYGGDPDRAAEIRAQITATLQQFPSVREVRILIEGQAKNALE